MKSFTSNLRLRLHDRESAFSLAEGLIAAVVILIILVATAAGLTTSFNASISSENRNKASELANNTLAIAKQAPFKSVGMPAPTTAQQTGCSTYAATYDGENRAVTTTSYPGLVYCQTKKFGNAGITYTVETNITWVGNFDSSTSSVNLTNTGYQPKRVTVKVTWADSADSSGNAITQNVVNSFIKTPTINECIPPGLNNASTSATGCSSYTSTTTTPPVVTVKKPRAPTNAARIVVNTEDGVYEFLGWTGTAAENATYSGTVAFSVEGCGSTSPIVSFMPTNYQTNYNGVFGMKDETGSMSCTGSTTIKVYAIDANGNKSTSALSITAASWQALAPTTGYMV